jgi:hypothetical protein
MKLRNETAETGHLLSFVLKEDRSDNFSLFFPVEGLEQFDTLLEVTKGFEKCLETGPGVYDYLGYSISDYGSVKKTYPEIDGNRIFFFEQCEFLSDELQFIEPFGKALLKRLALNHHQSFPDIITGGMAVGSNFYGREADIHNIWELLQKQKNILFRAPRRFGKTSLLNHIAQNPRKGWQVCFVDLEGGDSAEKFVEIILKTMWVKECFDPYLPSHLAGQQIYAETESKRLVRLKRERKTIQKDWKKYAENLFKQVENDSKDTRFLFILDEVSFLIEDMLEIKDLQGDSINELMGWLRDFRQRSKKIQFILSGSAHLPLFLSSFGIKDRLDDLEQAHLELFDKALAKEFIFLTLAGQKLMVKAGEVDQILLLMGKPIPYYLHLFLDAICSFCKEKRSLSSKEISKVYYEQLLGSESKRYFESIVGQLERYNRYGKRCTAGAKRILDILAESEKPVDMKYLKTIWNETTHNVEHFKVILDIMLDDFYLATDDNQHVFIDSRLIKEWWRKYGISGSR